MAGGYAAVLLVPLTRDFFALAAPSAAIAAAAAVGAALALLAGRGRTRADPAAPMTSRVPTPPLGLGAVPLTLAAAATVLPVVEGERWWRRRRIWSLRVSRIDARPRPDVRSRLRCDGVVCGKPVQWTPRRTLFVVLGGLAALLAVGGSFLYFGLKER